MGINGNRWSSTIIDGHQRSSMVINDHRWSSTIIDGHQRSSMVINGNQRASKVASSSMTSLVAHIRKCN